eukprot:675729-Hanusia_phi.AAC.1
MVEITSSKPKQSAFSSMHRYQIAKRLGDGTYGEVVRAINKQSGEVVAVKRMKKKYYSWDVSRRTSLSSMTSPRLPTLVLLRRLMPGSLTQNTSQQDGEDTLKRLDEEFLFQSP